MSDLAIRDWLDKAEEFVIHCYFSSSTMRFS